MNSKNKITIIQHDIMVYKQLQIKQYTTWISEQFSSVVNRLCLECSTWFVGSRDQYFAQISTAIGDD